MIHLTGSHINCNKVIYAVKMRKLSVMGVTSIEKTENKEKPEKTTAEMLSTKRTIMEV